MISIENFYWCIYENLLRSTGFCSAYYFPFGTRDAVIKETFDNRPHTAHGHVLHFDQEPMYTSDEHHLFQASNFNRIKYPSLLANSEHSRFKTEFCKRHDLLDWYYFFHGFAALDWYRDAAHITTNYPIINKFLCLNHLVRSKRAHRMALLSKLIEHDLIAQGKISFFATHQDCVDEICSEQSHLTQLDKDLVVTHLLKTVLPIYADSRLVQGSWSANFGLNEYVLRQQSFINVVTESVFFDAKLHLTEKIFQPIVTQRPFLLVAAPGNLQYLKSYGFQTFSTWIDESYDEESNHSVRLNMIIKELKKLCDMNIVELNKLLDDMQSVLLYNKRHFFGEFKTRLVNELVDNFDDSIKIWNNGRLRRQWPRLHNLDMVKNRLLNDRSHL